MTQTDPRVVAAPDPWLMPTPEMIRARDQIMRGQFFLVRNDGDLGERLRCTRCNGKHAYLTLLCVEQPFQGIGDGLFAFWHAAGAHGAQQYLSEQGRKLYDAIDHKLGPDFGATHPHLTRSLDIGPADLHFGALSMGTLETIGKADAQKRVWRINALGCRPPLSLPGLRGGL